MSAINIYSFVLVDEFKGRVDELIKSLKRTPTTPGFKEILMPGEPKFRNTAKGLKERIEIDDVT